jgi:hypothetical protein
MIFVIIVNISNYCIPKIIVVEAIINHSDN